MFKSAHDNYGRQVKLAWRFRLTVSLRWFRLDLRWHSGRGLDGGLDGVLGGGRGSVSRFILGGESGHLIGSSRQWMFGSDPGML